MLNKTNERLFAIAAKLSAFFKLLKSIIQVNLLSFRPQLSVSKSFIGMFKKK